MADTDTERADILSALRALEGVKLVATNWPKALDTTPCVLLMQAGESAADYRDDAEYLTEIEWYVRVFCKKDEQQRTLCRAVHEAMEALGYRRTFRWDEGAADVRQTVFRFMKQI
ncbi:MAG: hypothetical protein PHY12_06875 [Eubacteriales bacterium]|nr:hypothetical protein [Eubacteriales bacterium]